MRSPALDRPPSGGPHAFDYSASYIGVTPALAERFAAESTGSASPTVTFGAALHPFGPPSGPPRRRRRPRAEAMRPSGDSPARRRALLPAGEVPLSAGK